MREPLLFEKIEAYLTGQLPAEEAHRFEQEIASDENLAAEVELQRLELDFMDLGLEQDLKAKMARWKNEPPPNPFQGPTTPTAGHRPPPAAHRRRWLFLGGVALAVLAGLWFALDFSGKKQETPPKQETPAPSAPGPGPQQKETPTSPMPPQQQPGQPNANRPIAQADPAAFVENPFMENLVSSGFRSQGDLALKITAPFTGTSFQPDKSGAAGLRFAGSVEGAPPHGQLALRLLIFNNKDSNNPLRELPINLIADGHGAATFNLKQPLGFGQGLYYFTVEEIGTEQVLAAGKFFIKQ